MKQVERDRKKHPEKERECRSTEFSTEKCSKMTKFTYDVEDVECRQRIFGARKAAAHLCPRPSSLPCRIRSRDRPKSRQFATQNSSSETYRVTVDLHKPADATCARFANSHTISTTSMTSPRRQTTRDSRLLSGAARWRRSMRSIDCNYCARNTNVDEYAVMLLHTYLHVYIYSASQNNYCVIF